jgi:beta-lactamase superfamily II metal-dependent hydrolase
MSTVHFLNVGKGDCTLIEHNSGRDTLIDICKGNLALTIGRLNLIPDLSKSNLILQT